MGLPSIMTSYDEEAHMAYIRQEAREEVEEEIRQKFKELEGKNKEIAEKNKEIAEKDKALQEMRERNAKLLAEIEALKKGKL